MNNVAINVYQRENCARLHNRLIARLLGYSADLKQLDQSDAWFIERNDTSYWSDNNESPDNRIINRFSGLSIPPNSCNDTVSLCNIIIISI